MTIVRWVATGVVFVLAVAVVMSAAILVAYVLTIVTGSPYVDGHRP